MLHCGRSHEPFHFLRANIKLNIAACNANLDIEMATEAAPNSNNPRVLRVTAARSP